MTYLNVGKRRIETTIAYVGPGLSGKGTNLDHLRQSKNDPRIGRVESTTTDDGEHLSLAWQPDTGRFRDCDVFVNVVAQRGSFSADDAGQLRGADGVVFVVDAHPSAQERNRASLAAVRDFIARGERPDVPLVLQVNKIDLSDALAARDVVGALEADGLTHVPASAVRGHGVVETLEAALGEVLRAMQPDPARSGAAATTVAPGGAAGVTVPGSSAFNDGGHPLLMALRNVLRDTVREHVEQLVGQLETRMVTRMDAVLASRDRDEERLTVRVVELLQETDARVQQLVIAGASTVTKEDLAVVMMRVDRLRDETKTDVVRTMDVHARADRDHLSTMSSSLKKAVDVVAGEVKTADARARVGQVADLVESVARRTETVAEQMNATSERVQALHPRLEQLELAVKRLLRLEESLRGVRAEVTEITGGVAGLGGKTEAVHARVNEIVDELKKTKKGWFT